MSIVKPELTMAQARSTAQDRSRERANFARLEQTIASGVVRAQRGVDHYLA